MNNGGDPLRGRIEIVAIGASVGGPAALEAVLAGLPADFPAAVVVAQHRSSAYPSYLEEFLGRAVPLDVVAAESGMSLQPGTIHLAPPGRHLLVDADRCLVLSTAARHQYARPAVDLLFASVAASFGPHAVAVVLTGRQQDGAAGAWAVKARGGSVLVQDPADSAAPEMPLAAVRSGCADFVLPLNRIAPALVTLAMVPGAATLFRVPVEASLAHARRLWIA